MESRRPWVNLFSSLPDQVKNITGKSENLTFGRNDGRLMYGARRRTMYSSGRRPCRHRTHWANKDTGVPCGVFNWAVHQEI